MAAARTAEVGTKLTIALDRAAESVMNLQECTCCGAVMSIL